MLFYDEKFLLCSLGEAAGSQNHQDVTAFVSIRKREDKGTV